MDIFFLAEPCFFVLFYEVENKHSPKINYLISSFFEQSLSNFDKPKLLNKQAH